VRYAPPVPHHRVMDLRHLLDAHGNPVGPARELALWLGSLVECATATTREEVWIPAPVACQACAPTDYRVTALRRVGPGIEWFCAGCRASGTLTGWTGSPFDLSAHAEDERDVTRATLLFTRLDELTWLRVHAKEENLRVLLARARVEREHVVLLADQQDLTTLLTCVERAAPRTTGKERYALERFTGRCDALLALLERESGTGAGVLH